MDGTERGEVAQRVLHELLASCPGQEGILGAKASREAWERGLAGKRLAYKQLTA